MTSAEVLRFLFVLSMFLQITFFTVGEILLGVGYLLRICILELILQTMSLGPSNNCTILLR